MSVWKAFIPGLGMQQAHSAAGLLKINNKTWRPHNPDHGTGGRAFCAI